MVLQRQPHAHDSHTTHLWSVAEGPDEHESTLVSRVPVPSLQLRLMTISDLYSFCSVRLQLLLLRHLVIAITVDDATPPAIASPTSPSQPPDRSDVSDQAQPQLQGNNPRVLYSRQTTLESASNTLKPSLTSQQCICHLGWLPARPCGRSLRQLCF